MEQRLGIGLRPLLAGFFALLVLCAGVAGLFFAGRALAEPPPVYTPPGEAFTEPAPEGLPACSAAPEPLEGEAVVAELRSLRRDAAADCEALASRLDLVWHRLWWVTVELAEARPQRALGNEKLSSLVEGVEALTSVAGEPGSVTLEGVTSLEPLPVHETQQSAVTTPLESSIDASGEALKGALWFLAGAVVAGLVGYVIYRQVMPRA
jgi:hypothetical protein